MRESYVRSKAELKSLNSSKIKSKKSQVLDYDQYEQQLNHFQNDRKKPEITDLFDWTKPSEVISLKKPQRQLPQEGEPLQNNSMNTEELLRSQEGERERRYLEDNDFEDSIEIDSPVRSNLSHGGSYVQQIRSDYGSEYRLMSVIKLQSDMREMRERMVEMNVMLNRKLDKYELLSRDKIVLQPQSAPVNPYKLLSKQIELNSRIIQKQFLHLKKIDEKDKQLQKKDYLVQLSELIIEIKTQIHNLQKGKHNQSVDVQKIDKLLKEYEQVQENGQEYKEVKELKHLIVYYLKKLMEQKTVTEQLEQDHRRIIEREEEISHKLVQLAGIAQQKCLEVSTNKGYVQLKRRYDELADVADSHYRKKETFLKIQKGTEDKLEKQIGLLKKELNKVENQIQETEYRSIQVDEGTKEFMTTNKVLNKQLRSISYRFDESLIHPQRAKLKPDFRRRAVTRMDGKVNKTIDVDLRPSPNYPANDKNIPQITENRYSAEDDSSSAVSRMKPILRSWKGKASNVRHLPSPHKVDLTENSSIFKPSLLSRSRK